MEITRNGLNGLMWPEMAGRSGYSWKLLEQVRIGWKTPGMAENCLQWLKIAGMARN